MIWTSLIPISVCAKTWFEMVYMLFDRTLHSLKKVKTGLLAQNGSDLIRSDLFKRNQYLFDLIQYEHITDRPYLIQIN
jgi:hypothetical protein